MPAEVWSLWFRKDRSRPWECVFTGDSLRACIHADANFGSGDYYPKRGGDRPRGGSLCWDKKGK